MTARGVLRRLPPGLPLHAAVVGLLAWLVAEDAGNPVARWGLAAVLAVWVLGSAVVGLPRPRPSRLVVVGVAALGAHVAWSFLSAAWAAAPGDAWLGASRLVPCAALAALVALWPLPGRWPLAVLGGLLGVVGLVAADVLHELLRRPGDATFVSGRLAAPTGYPNATAMLWELALWPAVLLAGARAVHPAARAAAAGGAVVLADLVVLTGSRGAVLALPLTALVLLAVLPGRVRLAWAIGLVALGAATGAPAALAVAEAIDAQDAVAGAQVDAAAERAVLRALAAGLVVAAAAAVWGVVDRRTPGDARRVAHRVGGAAAAAGAVGVVLLGVAAAGGPGALPGRAADAWDSFRGGYAENRQEGSRLTSGLGSDRYDFYRVALEQVREAPLRGVGVDQFRAAYLREGRGLETPRHPHSLQLRLLSQTGVVGAGLFAAFLLALAAAALRRAREGGAGAAVAAAGLAGATAWVVHGSADWFLELPGLAATAFVLLAWAAGGGAGAAGPPLARSWPAMAATGLAVLALTAAVGGPWLADRDMVRAGAVLAERPGEALARLDRAARLDPLGAGPLLAEGTARLRLGDLAGADAAFAAALARDPAEQYATLMRGALASARGDRRAAERLLGRAVALAPRLELPRDLLRTVRRGGRVDLVALQRELLRRARR